MIVKKIEEERENPRNNERLFLCMGRDGEQKSERDHHYTNLLLLAAYRKDNKKQGWH